MKLQHLNYFLLLSHYYSVGNVFIGLNSEFDQTETETRPSENAPETEIRLRPFKSGLTKTNLQHCSTSRGAAETLLGPAFEYPTVRAG